MISSYNCIISSRLTVNELYNEGDTDSYKTCLKCLQIIMLWLNMSR